MALFTDKGHLRESFENVKNVCENEVEYVMLTLSGCPCSWESTILGSLWCDEDLVTQVSHTMKIL